MDCTVTTNYINEYDKFLSQFKQKFSGPKLSIVASGGGNSIFDIVKFPGGSHILHSFYAPYSFEESKDYISSNLGKQDGVNYLKKCVSPESSRLLYEAESARTFKHDIKVVTITAALTTTRYRRGANHAFISFKSDKTKMTEVVHILLPKLLEAKHIVTDDDFSLINSKRIEEDQYIARTALCLITGFDQEFLKKGFENGHIAFAL